MKKFKYLLVLLLVALCVPFTVFADGEETDASKINVYLFRGEGCPHCQEAEEWFASINEEYGKYFQVVDYETWYNEDNAKLMQDVAEFRGETANGVPYIIIGNKSWAGFTESYESEMLNEIEQQYGKSDADRYDIMKAMSLGGGSGSKKKEKKSDNDALSLIIILLVVGGVSFGVYKARSEN